MMEERKEEKVMINPFFIRFEIESLSLMRCVKMGVGVVSNKAGRRRRIR
jgi:hypothetical protein